MDTQVNNQLELIKKKLTDKFDLKEIFLFGSHAYGEPWKDSDLDLCIIINDFNNKRKIEVIRDIRRALINHVHNPIDILVYSKDEFKERARLKNTLEYKILMEGVRIYG